MLKAEMLPLLMLQEHTYPLLQQLAKVGLAVGLPSASGDVLSSNVEGVLSWVTQSGGSINAVDASGTFITTSTTAGVANVGLAAGLPSASGDVLPSTTACV